ncbi:hypothetical protein ANO11243_016870 [Dothideomycetidae sp. 11243]|nr:hypothetical protein ANO11243_016870 [fungal sp. No.11243]
MPNSVWASDRLVYRAPLPEDEDFIRKSWAADETGYTNLFATLPVPVGKKAAAKWREDIEKNLLGAIICIPEPEDKASTAGDGKANTNKDTPDKGTPTKPKSTPIGFIDLSNSPPNFSHHRRTTLGVWIAKDYQGKGYGSEAVRWCLEWAFLYANLHRVALTAFSWNTEVIKFYEKLGFTHEGKKRHAVWHDGDYHDVVCMGMLLEEWQERYGSEQQAREIS